MTRWTAVRDGFTLLTVCGLGCGCAAAGEKTVVPVRYTLAPVKQLPPGMETVAVLPAETADEADAMWSDLASNMVQGLLAESNARHGQGLRFADRDNIKRVLDEKDLTLAGIADGSMAGAAARLLAADALVCTRVSVRVAKHHGTGKTFSLADLGFNGGRPQLQVRDAQKVSRNILVQCSFRLIDARTGRVWIAHVGDTLQQRDEGKPSPFYGSDRTEADLEPRDQIIGQLVERSVRQFISQLVPLEVTERVELESDGNRSSKQAVRLAMAEEYEEALTRFQEALREDPESDRDAFGAGLMSECLGRLDKALAYYKQAILIEAEPEYLAAKDRVVRRIERNGKS